MLGQSSPQILLQPLQIHGRRIVGGMRSQFCGRIQHPFAVGPISTAGELHRRIRRRKHGMQLHRIFSLRQNECLVKLDVLHFERLGIEQRPADAQCRFNVSRTGKNDVFLDAMILEPCVQVQIQPGIPNRRGGADFGGQKWVRRESKPSGVHRARFAPVAFSLPGV